MEEHGVGGVFYAAAAAAVAFVVAGLIISFGTSVNSQQLSSIACDSAHTYNNSAQNCYLNTNASSTTGVTSAGNASIQVQTGMGTFASNLPTMASVGVAVLIIGLLIYGFSGLFKHNEGL